MRLSDLQNKDIVSVSDGKNIGSIIDVNINHNGNIESLIIEANKKFLSFNKDNDYVIDWNDITKIGEDVILVHKKN